MVCAFDVDKNLSVLALHGIISSLMVLHDMSSASGQTYGSYDESMNYLFHCRTDKLQVQMSVFFSPALMCSWDNANFGAYQTKNGIGNDRQTKTWNGVHITFAAILALSDIVQNSTRTQNVLLHFSLLNVERNSTRFVISFVINFDAGAIQVV